MSRFFQIHNCMQLSNWQVDVLVSLNGCEKKTTFKLRVEKEEEEKTTSCIFVIREDSLFFFYLGFVFLPFLLESWVFFGNVTRDSPLHHEWPGRNVCGGVEVWRRQRVWASEEEHWSLTGPKLSVRLERDTWDSADGCIYKAAANYSNKIPQTYWAPYITLFKIPLVTSHTWGSILIWLFDY